MTKQNVLEVKELSKKFVIGSINKRIVNAVNSINFYIKRKEILGLVGESGSGKSTVARVLSRLYVPTAGTIMLDGVEIPKDMSKKELRKYRKNVQMIFQDPFSSLNPLHNIFYTVERPLIVHKLGNQKEREERVKELFEICGLTPYQEFKDKLPHELSGGQKQRVGIARALAVKPKLILADEPTSMLDVSIRLNIMNLLLELKEEEHVSMLFITHDLAGAHYLSDRIAIMYAGSILEIGEADDIINSPKHPYTQLLKKAAPKPETGLEPENIETEGEVPDLTNLPKGCPFAPRCEHVKSECLTEFPLEVEVGKNHYTKCVLYY